MLGFVRYVHTKGGTSRASCRLQKHAVHLQSRRTHTTWSTQHAGVVVRCRGHALTQPQDALPPCWCQNTLMGSGMTANKRRPPSLVSGVRTAGCEEPLHHRTRTQLSMLSRCHIYHHAAVR